MLQKQKPATWLENPVDFGQSLAHIADAAQRECADDAIEGLVVERQAFTAQKLLLNFDSRLLDPSLCQPVHSGVRIDGRNLANVPRIVRQVQSRAKADFENMALGSGEQSSAVLGHQRLVQREVAQARKDYTRIEAHNFCLTS